MLSYAELPGLRLLKAIQHPITLLLLSDQPTWDGSLRRSIRSKLAIKNIVKNYPATYKQAVEPTQQYYGKANDLPTAAVNTPRNGNTPA